MKTTLCNLAIYITAAIIFASKATAQDGTSFSGDLRVWPNWTHVKTNGASVVTETFGNILSQSHASGTNANQMNAFVRRIETLTNGAAYTLNLAAATNSFGDAVNFWRVNFLAVRSRTNNAGNIVIGNAASDQLQLFSEVTNTATVYPGGLFLVTAPSAAGIVSTNKLLMIQNGSTNSATYELYIGGAQ